MASPIREQLLEALQKIDRPGTFCISGLLPPTLPGLEVAGVGPITLPLQKRQAASLKKRAKQAPYGKGTQTLVDTAVRRVWEIDADQVSLANPDWPGVVKRAALTAQSALGLEKQALTGDLYKLLLYEPGSFFLPHRDGEKLDRMVATLVIALPSSHEGGQLIVRHEGRTETVDFAPEGRFQTQFAAFYADCEHEVLPVTSGYRLALVYNLALAKSKQRITAPTQAEHIAALARILQQWKDGLGKTNKGTRQPKEEAGKIKKRVVARQASPTTKLTVILDHEYTKAGLTNETLKGIDRAKANLLFAAALQAGCDASLALVTKWVSGGVDEYEDYGYGYDYGRSRRGGRYRDDDDDDDDADEEETGASNHKMVEVYDESLSAQHFSDADGNPLAFNRIPLNADEIVSDTPLDEGEPDEEEFEGYTGNAGMTLDHWYHRAGIVLWPTESRFDVLCEAGVTAAVGGLEQIVQRWKKAKKSDQSLLQPQCVDFARRIIAHWPEQKFGSSYFTFDDHADYLGSSSADDFYDDGESQEDQDILTVDGTLYRKPAGSQAPQHPLLSLLAPLDDASLISDWLRRVLKKDVLVDPGSLLGDLCGQHGWATFQHELSELFESTTNETLERHARLLADWSLRENTAANRKKLCAHLAQQLISAVERWKPQQAKRDWRARVVDRAELLPLLMQTLLALEEPSLLERLVTCVLDRPKEFDLTTVQVPAWLKLDSWLKQHVPVSSAPLHRWLSALQTELEARVSRPPQAPSTWRRESATRCDCDDCKELSRFLKDSATKTLRMPLAKHRRQHLHQVIENGNLDVTHVTERRGSPQTLVCTKTQASYEKALKAHHVDLDQLKQIHNLLAWHASLTPKSRRSKSAAPKPAKRKPK